MKQNQQFEGNKMGVMPINKLLISMAAPMIASMLFQALYNVVDSIFVAMLSQDAMNAVSLAFPMQQLCMAFAIGTGVGINALLSRSLGEKDFERADKAANTGIFIYIVLGLVFAVLGALVAEPFYKTQTANQQIIKYGGDYLHVVMCFSMCLFGQVCSERLLQSTGRTDLAMIPQITGAVLNMILDPIMIFGLLGFPRLEVMGAAVATVCGQFVATVVGMTLNVKYNKEINLSVKKIRYDGRTVKQIFRIGFPSIIMQSIGSVMNYSLNLILISFTEAATAVFGAYYKIQSFVFLPVFGLNSALVPIIAYNYGAADMKRVKQAVKLAFIISISIMTVGLILFETIPATLLGLFSPSEDMLKVGTSALRIIGIHFPMAGFCIIAGSACQALEKPMATLITSMIRQVVVLLPAAYLLSLTGVLNMVWFAFPIAEVVSLIFNIFFIKRTFKEANAKIEARLAAVQE